MRKIFDLTCFFQDAIIRITEKICKGGIHMSKAALPHDHGQDIEHSLEKMPGLEDFQIAADIFKQLGDGSRLRIFWLLCHCEECVINISSLVDMSSPAVSHHLRQLKAAGLIVSRRSGRKSTIKRRTRKPLSFFIMLLNRS